MYCVSFCHLKKIIVLPWIITVISLCVALTTATKWYPKVDLPEISSIPADQTYRITKDSDTISIKSPNYPDNYPPLSNLSYLITGSTYPLMVQTTAFALQDPDKNGKCTRDRLAIWDLKYPFNLMKIACGTKLFNMTSYSDQIAILFLSDPSTELTGFELTITRAPCGQGDLWCPSDATICVPMDRICDGVQDCPDGEDEVCTTMCGTPATEPIQVRIVGGVDARPNSWPWQVYVSLQTSYCGGSVIAPQWIITAAHCCSKDGVNLKPGDFELYMGFTTCYPEIDADRTLVKAVFVDPNYTKLQSGVNRDFCLLQLNEEVKFTGQVSPICLPRPHTGPAIGDVCAATGCGYTNANNGSAKVKNTYATTLQQVDLAVDDFTDCSNYYYQVTPEMVCAGRPGKDACQGDSGGPLACHLAGPDGIASAQWQLSGLTSFGLGCATGSPGVYADMRMALPFVIKTIYSVERLGWFSDTSVPVVDHLKYGNVPFEVKKSNHSKKVNASDDSDQSGTASGVPSSGLSIFMTFSLMCLLRFYR